MPLRFAVLFLALMLIYPQESLSAARDAFALWQQTVAPSLLPFFALIPALTCPEAAACFARLLKWPCRLLAVPEEFAGAAGVALSAGSPAGARALMCIAVRSRYPAGAVFRAVMLCSGVSPGFLISGVGAGMLGDPSSGMILLISQILALFTASRLLLWAGLPDSSLSLPGEPAAGNPSPILFAAQGVLSILVWMTVFAVGSRIAGMLFPAAEPYLPFFAEFSTGCAHAVEISLSRKQTLPLLGAVIGFGGICAGCQNLAVLRPLGIPAPMYFAAKLIHAALCALFARALCSLSIPEISFAQRHVLPVLAAVCMVPLLRRRVHSTKS